MTTRIRYRGAVELVRLHRGPFFIDVRGYVSLKSMPRSASLERFTRGIDMLISFPSGQVLQVGESLLFEADGVSFSVPLAQIKSVSTASCLRIWPPLRTSR